MPEASRDFLLWSRYGSHDRHRGLHFGPVAGAQLVQQHRELHRRQWEPFCAAESARALQMAASSNAPKHMRSDVDRIVFGRDMDGSEAATAADTEVSSWNTRRLDRGDSPADGNALQARLRKSGDLSRSGPTPASSWAGPAAEYLSVRPTMINIGDFSCQRHELQQRRIGAPRPSMVTPRPQSAGRHHLIGAARGTAAFEQEMDKYRKAREAAHLHRPKTAPRDGFRKTAIY